MVTPALKRSSTIAQDSAKTFVLSSSSSKTVTEGLGGLIETKAEDGDDVGELNRETAFKFVRQTGGYLTWTMLICFRCCNPEINLMHQNYWAEYSALSHEDQRELLWIKLPWLFFLVIFE